MGVKQLWKILSPCGKKPALKNKTLAVDTSIWMHHYKSVPDNMVTISIAKRIFSILYNEIRPVFIFDGKPSALKRETIRKRKEDEMRSLIRRIVLNKKCRMCGKLLRDCEHINDFSGPEMKRLNEEALMKLKNHNYKWGEASTESSEELYLDSEDQTVDSELMLDHKATTGDHKDVLRHDTVPANERSIANFDDESLEGLSRQQQLRVLVDLLSKRKLGLGFDNSNSMSFSTSQIENVKKRNKISALIKGLNKNAKKTIQSDCTTYAILDKDQPSIYRAFYHSEDPVSKEPVNEDEEAVSSDINELFDRYEVGEWEKVFEKYETGAVESDAKQLENDMAVKHVQYNTDVLNTIERGYKPPKTSTIQRSITAMEPESAASVAVEADVEDESELSEIDSFDILESSVDSTSSESEATVHRSEAIKISDFEVQNSDIQRVQKLITELLTVLELPYIESVGEADGQCGFLVRNGLVDGVITEDNDMIIQKATVYKNFFRKDKEIVCYSYSDVVDELGLDQDALIKIGYLLGSDYCKGMKGVGVKTVLSKLESVSEEDIAPYRDLYNDENVKRVEEIHFGALNTGKLRSYLLTRGVEQSRVNELMLYCKKIIQG